jgi:very-short-patch-repair endonuclease
MRCDTLSDVAKKSRRQGVGRLHDSKRDAFLTAQGFMVIRFDNDQVIDSPDYVFLEIEKRISHVLKDKGHD